MPRSILRPQTGSIVWYYAEAPPATGPHAALVVNRVNNTTFGLYVFDRANGAPTYVASVPFHYGTRPTSGAWCTSMRVNEPASGTQWPSSNMEAHDYEINGLDQEQREARDERIAAQQQAQAAIEPTPDQARQARLEAEYAKAAG